MQTSLQKLQTLLQQLFRADGADLDFGIYRIINYRRDQIQNFITEQLRAIVNDALDANSDAESAHQEIETLTQRIVQTLGGNVLDADGDLINETYRETPLVQQYLEAQERHGSPRSRGQREDTVYNHLYTFFSRYYDNGDFIPRRRYSQTERYAVPYNGEEVYLHWVNRDQYYVKSTSISPLIVSSPKTSPSPLNFATLTLNETTSKVRNAFSFPYILRRHIHQKPMRYASLLNTALLLIPKKNATAAKNNKRKSLMPPSQKS